MHECLDVAARKIITELEGLASVSFLKDFCHQLERIIDPLKSEPETIKTIQTWVFHPLSFLVVWLMPIELTVQILKILRMFN